MNVATNRQLGTRRSVQSAVSAFRTSAVTVLPMIVQIEVPASTRSSASANQCPLARDSFYVVVSFNASSILLLETF